MVDLIASKQWGAPRPVLHGGSATLRQSAMYRQRNLIERVFCKLKQFRRAATRSDKLVRNFFAAALLASIDIVSTLTSPSSAANAPALI